MRPPGRLTRPGGMPHRTLLLLCAPQAAMLLAAARMEGLTRGPALVVAPLSTIGAWERELAKWAPSLAVLPYIGGQSARETIQR